MCEAGSASLLPPTGLDTRHRRLANAHVVQMCYVHPVTSPAPEYTMSTTTIRLPDELKARIAEAAKRAGTTSHNFILEAIAEKADLARSEEHTSELQSLMRISYAVFCSKKKNIVYKTTFKQSTTHLYYQLPTH